MAQEGNPCIWAPGSIPGRDTSFDVPESSFLLSGPWLHLESRNTNGRHLHAAPTLRGSQEFLRQKPRFRSASLQNTIASCLYMWFTLSALFVGCGLLVTAQPTMRRELQSEINKGEFMFSPCPQGSSVLQPERHRIWTDASLGVRIYLPHPTRVFATDHAGIGCGQKTYVANADKTRAELEV